MSKSFKRPSRSGHKAICAALNRLFWNIVPTRGDMSTDEFAQWIMAELKDADIFIRFDNEFELFKPDESPRKRKGT